MKRKFFIILLILFWCILLTTVSKAENDVIVILDPGHGGYESGAVGGNINEKDVTWKIAKRVKDILDNTSGITGYLTREENQNPSLYDRGLLAKNKGADLLVSFHINSSSYVNNLSGAETYITGNTNSPRFYESSKKLGQSVLANLRAIGIPSHIYTPVKKMSTDGELYSDGFLSDYYGIIRNPMYYGIPGVLIEHCYINNVYDRNNFLTDIKINQMAEQDAKAIIDNKELFRINRNNNAINATLDNIVVNIENRYLMGEITAIDWINDMQRIPELKVKLVTEKGNIVKECFVNPLGGYKFYFDMNLKNLEENQKYKIQIESLDKVNIPIRHTIDLSFKDRLIGEIDGSKIKCENNRIILEEKPYEGNINTELTDIQIKGNATGTAYIKGDIIIVEWINGISNIPKTVPKMKLKATDGSKEYMLNLHQKIDHQYTFDFYDVKNIDISKEYQIEIESGNANNISSGRKGIVRITDKKIGMYQNYTVNVLKNNISFILDEYKGSIKTEFKEFNVRKTGNGLDYITGKVQVTEIIDGVENNAFVKPKITLIAEDNTMEIPCYVDSLEKNQYYFDRNVTGIDSTKTYRIQVELSEPNNISIDKKQNIDFGVKKKQGEIQNYNVITFNHTIAFTKEYIGNVNSELIDIQTIKNRSGLSYITGELVIVEWIDGISNVPKYLPKMTLQSTDGEIKIDCYLDQIAGHRYYFDRNVTGIDKSKSYILTLELTDKDNISSNKKMNINFGKRTAIGKFDNIYVNIKNNSITFSDKYIGNVNSEVTGIKLNKNSDNRKYFYGNIVIVEWVKEEGTNKYISTVPSKLPKMTFKDEVGNSYPIYISQVSGHNYYFDRFIEGLDTTKQYYIELELSDEKNIGYNKKMKVFFEEKEIGIFENTKMLTKGNSIVFERF